MQKITPPFSHKDVSAVYASYPAAGRDKLFVIRSLIFKTAQSIPEVGNIEEILKWGEPSYLTTESKSGSTVRLAWKKTMPNQYGIYFNCKTSIIETIKSLYGDALQYQKNRAIIFNIDNEIPVEIVEHCVSIALTYHLKNK
jgi:hypothetical protein